MAHYHLVHKVSGNTLCCHPFSDEDRDCMYSKRMYIQCLQTSKEEADKAVKLLASVGQEFVAVDGKCPEYYSQGEY